MNIKSYIEDYVIKANKPFSEVAVKIEIEYLADRITETEREELLALAESTCDPDAELPSESDRLSAIEERLSVIEKRIGIVVDIDYPIMSGKATSKDAYHHCGQRVSCDVDGDGVLERYWCKLAPKWDSTGTAYAPNSEGQTCWVAIEQDATEEEITATVQEFMDRYPDYTDWLYGADGKLIAEEG